MVKIKLFIVSRAISATYTKIEDIESTARVLFIIDAMQSAGNQITSTLIDNTLLSIVLPIITSQEWRVCTVIAWRIAFGNFAAVFSPNMSRVTVV